MYYVVSRECEKTPMMSHPSFRLRSEVLVFFDGYSSSLLTGENAWEWGK